MVSCKQVVFLRLTDTRRWVAESAFCARGVGSIRSAHSAKKDEHAMTHDQGSRKTEVQREAYPKSTSRRVNAWLSVLVSVLFLLHSCMGAAYFVLPGMRTAPRLLLWLGVLLILAHIVASIITTNQMLTDTVRPPSARKKRHQLKKWVTGVLFVLAAGVHIGAQANGVLQGASAVLLMAVVSVLLCVHLCTGVKSLTRDMALSPSLRWPLRLLAIAVSVLVCAVALVVLL